MPGKGKGKGGKNSKKRSKDLNKNTNSTGIVVDPVDIVKTNVAKRTRSMAADKSMDAEVATAAAVSSNHIPDKSLRRKVPKSCKTIEFKQVTPDKRVVIEKKTIKTSSTISAPGSPGADCDGETDQTVEDVDRMVEPQRLNFEQINQFDELPGEEGDGIDVDVSPSDEERFPDNEDSDVNEEDRFEVNENLDDDATTQASFETEVTFNRKEMLRKDPEVQRLVQELVKEKLKAEKTAGSGKATGKTIPNVPHIKSPSDTTVYAPALRHSLEVNQVHGMGVPSINFPRDSILVGNAEQQMGNQVARFVEQVRMQTTADSRRSLARDDEPQPSTSQQASGEQAQQIDQARNLANDMVLQAEKFKAAVAPLPGMLETPHSQVNMVSVDDQFFHISCHIEQSLKEKIERGEFIELERLLTKPQHSYQNGQKLELFSKDGNTYFAPAERNNKISGVKRWEQAFRVYAAIYCRANPHRSAEIWQYIHVIHTAASAYIWDNVAQYDFTFRQLMSAYPSRSWANIYQQMWSLSMREPLHRQQQYYQSPQSTVATSQGFAQGSKEKRKRYCWKYNKNRTHDADCKFEHKCKFCDAPSHGYYNCPKRQKRSGGGGDAAAQ